MEYVNLTKNINNIKRQKLKEETKMKLKNTKDEIYKLKKSNSKIRTPDVTTKSTTPITARPHQTLQNVAQNKEYGKLQISSRILSWFSQVFLRSGLYGFVIFLLHRETNFTKF